MRARASAMIVGVSLLTACADRTLPPRELAGADFDRGRQVVERAACGACHEIPGVAWPRGRTGGSLKGFGSRTLIAGRIPNQPDALVRWLQDPATLTPAIGMPVTGLTAAEARDVAAFLYTLR